MIKNILTIMFVIFATLSFSSKNVFAYSCPMLWAEIDEAISKLDVNNDKAIIAAATNLRNEGVNLHDNGDHGKSEDILNAALRLLDI
tara:strand:+ start:621 stop:881 length:261 start_codon:yes stop_codon:yes gene_type:complete